MKFGLWVGQGLKMAHKKNLARLAHILATFWPFFKKVVKNSKKKFFLKATENPLEEVDLSANLGMG